MLQTVLKAAMENDNGVKAIVSDRVFVTAAGDGEARPYIVLTFTGGAELSTLEGLSKLKRDTVEIAAVADTAEAAAALERAIEAAIMALPAAPATTIALVTPQGRPYDSPSIDPQQTIFAVVRLWRIDHRP